MEHNQPDNELFSAYSLAEKPAIDLETVQKAMQGDKEAFSALFMQTYRTMFLVVRRFLARDEDIYDALQNGYTKAYKYLPRLQAPEAFLNWLKKAMENAARDIRADITSREAAQEDMAEFADELTVDDTESSERRADIQEVLSRLEPRQAEVLTLYYYDGMKLSEIAGLLDEPQSTVRSRFAQAKKTALALFKEKGIDKTVYGGSVAAILTCALRNAVGSSILSAVVAQNMLEHILSGQWKNSREGTALYRLLEEKRNRAIRRMASLLITPTVAVCAAAVLFAGLFGRLNGTRPPVLPVNRTSYVSETQRPGGESTPAPSGTMHTQNPSTEIASSAASPASPSGNTTASTAPTAPTASVSSGVYSRSILGSPDKLAAALNKAAGDFTDAIKNYTMELDGNWESATINPASYTRLYGAFQAFQMGLHDAFDGRTPFGETFLRRYSANDEWYFYRVENGGGHTHVAVNNTTGELFMEGVPEENAALSPWQMFLLYKTLIGKGGAEYRDISLYQEVVNALPPHLNTYDFGAELRCETSDRFHRENANGFSLTDERAGYVFQKYVYLKSIPIYIDDKHTNRRCEYGHILYCAPKAVYQAFSFAVSGAAQQKKWETLWTDLDSFASLSLDILERKTLSNGWYRLRFQARGTSTQGETMPFTLTFSPYGDYVGFQIEQPLRLPPGNSQDENAVVLNEYKTKWKNTRAAWLSLLESRFNPPQLRSIGEENETALKEKIVSHLPPWDDGGSWYGMGEQASGVAYQYTVVNGVADEYEAYPVDGDGWFTMTDTLDLYFI